jgi:hypothetical protein
MIVPGACCGTRPALFRLLLSQRYYDTLYLADGTLQAVQSDRNIEESYYWRAMAKRRFWAAPAQSGLQESLKYHPASHRHYQLKLLGVKPLIKFNPMHQTHPLPLRCHPA